MKPSIGRIVTYRTLDGYDVPAIITAVPGVEGHPAPPAEGCVHLHVFYPAGLREDYLPARGVPHQAGPGGWSWPERV